MTTIGVKPVHSDRILSMDVPPYSYSTPHMPGGSNDLHKVRLAAVKHELYNPKLPSFRRMDMDTAGHKLPEEHSRTATSCGPEDYHRARSSIFPQASYPFNIKECTDTGRKVMYSAYSTNNKDELQNTALDWSDFLNRSPERYNIRLPDKKLCFNGYAVRYLRPEVTGSWRYTLRQEPSVDQYGRKPMPANVFSRYRETYPQYSRDMSRDAWR